MQIPTNAMLTASADPSVYEEYPTTLSSDRGSEIVKIETFDLRVPLDRVMSDSVNITDSWGFATVRLHTRDGLVGTGYTGTARGAGNSLILAAIQDYYSEHLLGKDSRNIRGLWHEMYWSELHWCGRAGVSQMALAAVDIALWDLAALRDERPLCDLLGGSTAQSFQAYNTNGGWLSFTDDELVANAKESVDSGFLGLKVKLGLPDGRRDIDRISKVRSAIGDGIDLMTDVNQAWTLASGAQFGSALADYDIAWLEEPLDPDDWRAHASLARMVNTPLALGEHLYSLHAFSEFILAEAVTYVQPDTTRLGGITEFLQVASLAASHQLPLCPHAGDMMQVHSHLVFVAATAHRFEYIPWGRELFAHPASVKDGRILRPQAPGASTEMHDTSIERYLVSPMRTNELSA